MSGGSFNYLDIRLRSDPFNVSLSDIDDMINFLKREGVDDVAAELTALKQKIINIEMELTQRAKVISGVLHAAEWWQSSDWSEDQFREAVEEYRTSTGQSK